MRYFILAFILIIGQNSFGQDCFQVRVDTINRLDSDSLKQGIWNEYLSNGQLCNQISYVDGKEDGAYFYFDKDGELSSLGFFNQGEKTGYSFSMRDRKLWRTHLVVDSSKYPIITEFFSNQLPKTGGSFYAGKGEKIEFYANGSTKNIFNYNSHKKEGYYSLYAQTGQLLEHGVIKKERPWTIYCSFDSLGSPIDFGTLNNGVGILKIRYDDGTIKKIEEYKEGMYWNTVLLHSISGEDLNIGTIKDGRGIMLDYYQNSEVKTSTTFRDGIRNGNYYEYSENGMMTLSGKYKDDKEEGPWILYDEYGVFQSKYLYEKGQVISISCR